MQKQPQRLLSLLLAFVMIFTCAPAAFAESTEAAMMRLMKTEGTVSVTNSKGRSVAARDEMRLNNGYGLETGEASYAWINLDDSKLVKMDAVTEISIRKSGKKLDILLDSGNLFFNVSKPLEEDETLHIRTSTMAIGVRGTCGWVKVIDQWTSQLFVLEGTVEVTVTDPVTGETKTDTVKGGETVICKVYPQDTSGSKCDIIRQGFTVSDIEGFVLVELVKDRTLCEKIKQDSGLDILGSGIDAVQKLKEDQQRVHDRLEEINGQLTSQENNISKDPVWTNPVSDGTLPSDDTDDDSCPDTTPTVPTETITLTMPQTAAEVNNVLGRATVRQVILQPGTRARSSTAMLLDVDSYLSVPSGKVLTLQSGVGLTAANGRMLAVNGTLTVGGDFRLAGDLAAGSSGIIKSTAFKLDASVVNWKVSSTTDGAGYYTLLYSPQGVYTVTFNANGGTVSPAQMQTGTDGRLTVLPTSTRAGYTFAGWYTAAEGGVQITEDYVFDRDTIVYAHWTVAGARHTITFDATGGTVTPTSSVTDADGRLSSTAQIPDVPADATCFNGNFYKIYRTTLNWGDAKTYCEQLDGHLASITSAEEQSFIDSLNASSARLWIGGYRDDNFNWFWVTGEPWGYTNWAAGEPNDSGNVVSNENRTALWPRQWNDLNENNRSEQSGFVCEWEVGAVLPIPTREGYTFDGWFTAAEGGMQVTTATVFTRDTTVFAHWTEESTSGVTWRYDEPTKTLYITGNGPIEIDYHDYDSIPWSSCRTEAEAVVIEEGITAIGNYAFYDFGNLASYTVPSSVTSIGDRAFRYNYKMTNFTIPSRVTSIGEYAFYGCSALTSMVIPEGVTRIGALAFWNCNSMTSITIPNSVNDIGIGAFSDCAGLTSITIPNGVTTIRNAAFETCTNLNNVRIPASVTQIISRAFNECDSLTDVYFGGIKAQWNAITIENTNDPLLNATIHCTDGDITPGGGEEVGGEAGENLNWGYNPDTRVLRIWGTGTMKHFDSIEDTPWAQYADQIQSITIDNGVTSIGNNAFQGCKELTNVTIADSVIGIGNYAFNNCSSLVSVPIPNSVTRIEDNAFGACSSLGSITIPDSVTIIGRSAFQGCSTLYSVTIPDGVISINYGTFNGCSGLRSVIISDSVLSIGNYAFNGCDSLTYVYYIGTEAQWKAINIGSGNAPLTTAPSHQYNYNSSRSAVSYSAPVIYTDVPSTAPYAEAVQYCKDNNLMTGTSATEFTPDGTLTRAMMVTVLHRLAGKPFAYATGNFADVPAGKWYSEAITWASSKGIVNGYNPTTFGTNDPVTHEQVGWILQRYSGDPSVEVTGGESPKTPATRAEVAMTLMNYMKGRKPGTLSDTSAIDVMCAPSGIALDKDGNLFVTDVYGKQLWKVQNRIGTAYAGGATVLDLYGQPMGGYNDAGLQNSYFKEPWAIAPFLDGWAVSDTANNVVRLVSSSSVKTLNGATNEKLKVTNLGVAFNGPTGLASDGAGNLYVSDTLNGAVRRVTPDGGVKTVAQNLSEPTGLCWKDGALYIAETGRNRIVKLEKGKVTTVAGSGEDALTDGSAQQAAFSAPKGVAVGDDGSVYVADTGNSAVRVVKGGAVTTLAVRDPEQLGGGLMSPTGLMVRGNSLYICDTFARRIFVYQQ